MSRILTEPSLTDLQKQSKQKKKRIILMKVFKQSSQAQSASSRNDLSQIQHSQLNPLPNYKTCRPIQEQVQTSRYLSQIRTKTEIIGKNSLQKRNIFQNSYIDCLKNGYTNAYEESSKITSKKMQLNDFDGPVYDCQHQQKHRESNPETINNQIIHEEIYKYDRNPKLMKLKVSLKKYSLNLSSNRQQQSQSRMYNKSSVSRVLLTQARTQQSNASAMSTVPQKVESLPHKLSAPNYSSLHPSQQKNKFPLNIPKLKQHSNLLKSIKIFERRQSLLGQIQSSKGLEQKYGDRLFEYMIRDRYREAERKNDFVMKVEYDKKSNKPIEALKSHFVRKIQQGQFQTRFRYNHNPLPLKLKGNSQKPIKMPTQYPQNISH